MNEKVDSRNAELDAHHRRMISCQEATEAYPEKVELNAEEIKSRGAGEGP
jgi:hypothetical protein